MQAESNLAGESRATTLSQPFWDGLHRGELMFQRCFQCGRRQHYPRLLCRFCSSTSLEWGAASPAGTVVSAVVTHRTSRDELTDRLPYTIAIVRMEDGPHVMATTVPGSPELDVGIDVEIDFVATARSGVLMVAARTPTGLQEGTC